EVCDLVKTYPGPRGGAPVRALDQLSIRVAAGTIFGLLGPNGAGKSTTVKILTTLSRPDSGDARVAGIDPMATGRENLLLAARIQGLSRRAAATRAGELLDRFGLTDAANRLVRTYSGGMARRLDVAIGLVHRPQVLFLDEADRLADRLAIVDRGRVVVEGTADDLKRELRGDAIVVELGTAAQMAAAITRLGRVPG